MMKRLMFGALMLAPLAAQAQVTPPDCSTLPTPIYIGGSSAISPFVKEMGKNLAGLSSPVTLIYQKLGSCAGVNVMLADTDAATCQPGGCVMGTGTYYDTTGTAQMCNLAQTGTHLDVAVSDVYPSSCSGVSSLPSTYADTTGPIQAMLFVVPRVGSDQTSITAKQGFMVFGYPDGTGMSDSPWTSTLLKAIRNAGSGTQTMTSKAILLPDPTKMNGTDSLNSDGVVSAISMTTMQENRIGILGSDVYDQHKDTLKALAFEALHQWHGYLPDSTDSALDKQNVRDGHYWIWGPVHMVTHSTDGTNPIVGSSAETFLDYVSGKTAGGFDPVDIAIQAHIIPVCAMHVTRSSELGPLSTYDDATPCDCFFEAAGSQAKPTSCNSCTSPDGTACSSGGVCRRGYCEAH
jgi:ABC-type phosphate transport system substrate-binding protein